MRPTFFGIVAGGGAVTPIALIANASAYNPGGGPPGVTSAIDTTGATLLVAAVSQVFGDVTTLTDSKGNTWTKLTERAGGILAVQLHYVLAPTVGTNHTFSLAGSNTSVCVGAFSNVGAFESQSGAGSASATTQQPGSLTPASDNALLVTGLEFVDWTNPGSSSINGSFLITDNQASPASSVAVAMAYLVQTTTAAANPTWSSNVAAERVAAAMAVFTHV